MRPLALRPSSPQSTQAVSQSAVRPPAGTGVQQRIDSADIVSPLRQMAFKCSLGVIFLQFSMLHQTLAGILHVNFYLLYFFAIPALIGLGLSPGLKYGFRNRQAIYWCGFAVWMALAIPTSYWKGGSIHLVTNYWRTDLTIFLIVAGLTMTFAECQKVMWAVAWGAVADILTARFLQGDGTDAYAGRLGLQEGSVSNPNDFAAHMILAISFLLWVTLSSKSKLMRVGAAIGLVFGMILILKTASRGAEVGLAGAMLVYFFLSPVKQKLALALLVPVGIIGVFTTLSPETLQRLKSFSPSSDYGSAVDLGAIESSQSREYLLRTSLKYSAQFPLFGVGPGMFSFYEGEHSAYGGTQHGYWHDAHNSFTQVSSECGIPAAVFFILGAGSTIVILRRVRANAQKRSDCKDIEIAALSLLVGATGFYIAIFFLNFAYLFYAPFLGGLAVALSRAAQHEFAVRGNKGVAPGVVNESKPVSLPKVTLPVREKAEQAGPHRTWGRR